MKKILILLSITIVLMGCNSKNENDIRRDPDIVGLIYESNQNRILVVSDIENADIPYDELFQGGYNAIYFTINDKTIINEGNTKTSASELRKGQAVEAWSTGALAESYPMQGTAAQINILDSNK